jgi:hypothetical protein
MADTPASSSLSGEEILALRFAAHRQLARWAKKPWLSPVQHMRRDALKRAVSVLHDPAFAHGCKLHATSAGEQP